MPRKDTNLNVKSEAHQGGKSLKGKGCAERGEWGIISNYQLRSCCPALPGLLSASHLQ